MSVEKISKFGEMKNGNEITFFFRKTKKLNKEMALECLIEETMNPDHDKVDFLVSNFSMNLCPGSWDSLNLLDTFMECNGAVMYTNAGHIIDYKWQMLSKYVYMNTAFFSCFMLTFLSYVCFFFGNVVILLLLLLLAVLSLAYEVFQVYVGGFTDYFTDIWNYFDFFGFLLTIIYCILKLAAFTGLEENLLLVAFFCVFVRGLSMLRSFKSTRYFIGMILQTVKDVAAFMIIFFFALFGFCLLNILVHFDSFGEEGVPLTEFIKEMGVQYRVGLGDFDTAGYNTGTWIIFLIATFFVTLIMLNMLIAIMGNTFSEVTAIYQATDYKEKAALLGDIERAMIWNREKKEHYYMHICRTLDVSLSDNNTEAKIRELTVGMQ